MGREIRDDQAAVVLSPDGTIEIFVPKDCDPDDDMATCGLHVGIAAFLGVTAKHLKELFESVEDDDDRS